MGDVRTVGDCRGKEGSFGRWVSILYRYGRAYSDRELRTYGLGSGQFIFLHVLLHRDGLSQEELACLLKIDKGTTARALKRLEDAGYVTRCLDKHDKRVNRVFVTEKGRALGPKLAELSRTWTDALARGFSQTEREQATALLKRMAENAALFLQEKDPGQGGEQGDYQC